MTATTLASPEGPAATGPLRLKIAGMDCGSCALTIEKAVGTLPGVESVRVDFTTEVLEASGRPSREAIERKLRELGYRVADESGRPEPPRFTARGAAGFLHFLRTETRTRIALALTGVLALATVWRLAAGPDGAPVLDLALLATVAIVGWPILVKGVRSLLVARRITIDLLMGIAAVGAVAIGEVGEAAAVVLLFTLGEALEAYSAERSRDALRSLLALQPDEATVLEAHLEDHGPAPTIHEHGAHCDHDHDDDHDHHQAHASHAHGPELHFHQVRRPTGVVPVGARVLVRPGERIPLDGLILEGSSGINQAAVTGESMPVQRTVGQEVLAGTVNGQGALTIEVLRPAGSSTVARIARLVENALAQRTPAERFIDRFAQWYTPLVVALAVLVVAIPVLLFSQPLLNPADGSYGWLYRGLALLIIACPCALIISIPVTVVSALTRLAQQGVLVKGGAQLDRLADIGVIAFDKTGTLTVGRPSVTTVRGRECAHPETTLEECPSCDDVVAMAAAVESASEHPLAQAVVSQAAHRGVIARAPTAAGVTAHVGRGVSGEIAGQRVAVGSHELFSHGPECTDQVCSTAVSAEAAGQTVMLVGRGERVLGFIGVEDRPRPESGAALAELHALDPGLRTVMLTGDNPGVAAAIARRIGGLDEVRASLLPEGKLAAVEELRGSGRSVAMVGDGINDAPALARADVGIAMGGGGTAQAMETADVVLIKDDLRAIPMTLRISRQTRAIIKQNIALSLGLKLAVLALAIPGLASLWLAVVADVGATLIVTLNGMRLLRAR